VRSDVCQALICGRGLHKIGSSGPLANPHLVLHVSLILRGGLKVPPNLEAWRRMLA
jgi:hypothetical protein